MIIFWIAAPIYILALIVSVSMGIKRGALFIGFLLLITLLLYLMFFHSTESALGVVIIGVITYLMSSKR
uniref:Choline transport protein BetT n=1 Tax=Sphingobacterium sp. (strain 21) TaxID=743722 RepID=F4C5Q2_SPHS2